MTWTVDLIVALPIIGSELGSVRYIGYIRAPGVVLNAAEYL